MVGLASARKQQGLRMVRLETAGVKRDVFFFFFTGFRTGDGWFNGWVMGRIWLFKHGEKTNADDDS